MVYSDGKFSTHVGFYQYRRLSFGINSAAEIFQHTIQTLIADIRGAQNVSDDCLGTYFQQKVSLPPPRKSKRLQDAFEPRNPTELCLFLGMALYSARFIQNFATITDPLR